MARDKALTLEPTADEAAEIQAAIKQMLAEMDRIRQQMIRDEADTERSQMRTRVMLERLKTLI